MFVTMVLCFKVIFMKVGREGIKIECIKLQYCKVSVKNREQSCPGGTSTCKSGKLCYNEGKIL